MTNQNLLLTAGILALGCYCFFYQQKNNTPNSINDEKATAIILDKLITQINQLNNTI